MNLFSKLINRALVACALVVVVLGQHSGNVHCGDPFRPLLSVPDVNGDGTVDTADIAEVIDYLQGPPDAPYLALYDINADGAVTGADVGRISSSMGLTSSNLDQEAVRAFNLGRHLRGEKNELEWRQQGIVPLNVPLKGHGTHWFTPSGLASLQGIVPTDFSQLQGLNIGGEGYGAPGDLEALFFSHPGLVVFEPNDGGSWTYIPGTNLTWMDYPTCQPPSAACSWIHHAPVMFANPPPQITENPCEMWHAHGGLCVWEDAYGLQHLDQHLSFAECELDTPDSVNNASWTAPPWNLPPRIYLNFWMVHYWNYNPNPRGLFANTHPCVSPNGLAEDDINIRVRTQYGRDVPMWFHHLHSMEAPPGCGPIGDDE